VGGGETSSEEAAATFLQNVKQNPQRVEKETIGEQARCFLVRSSFGSSRRERERERRVGEGRVYFASTRSKEADAEHKVCRICQTESSPRPPHNKRFCKTLGLRLFFFFSADTDVARERSREDR